jgi:NitT/TauT family transport system substrate-binding protein
MHFAAAADWIGRAGEMMLPSLRNGSLACRLDVVAAFVACIAFAKSPALAQSVTVRLAKQFGISYLPLTIVEEQHLLEAEGKALGLDIKTEWLRFTSGTPMNEALI